MRSKYDLIKIRNWAFLYTAIIVTLMGILMFIFLILPFAKYLFESEKISFFSDSRSRSQILDSYILKYIDIAKQIASRTKIRDRLRDYNENKVSLEELVNFSVPKLLDAILEVREIRGIVRCGIGKKPLITIGDPIPSKFLNKVDTDSIWISSPYKINNNYFITLVSPIFDRDGKRVGTDIILFDFNQIKDSILMPFEHFPLASLGLGGIREEKPYLFFSYLKDRGDLAFLKEGISKALGLKTPQMKRVKIDSLAPHFTFYVPLKSTDWVFVSTINENILLSPIRRVILRSSLFVIIFIFLGIIGISYIFYLFIKNMIKNYKQLKEEISLKSILLSEEIQKRKSIEEAYALSVNIFSTTFDTVPLPIGVKEVKNGKYILVNKSFLDLTEKDIKDVIDRGVYDIWSEEDAKKFKEMDKRVITTKSMIVYEDYLRIPGKDELYGIITKSPFFDGKGNVAGIVSTFFDLTQRKKMEKELNLLASLIEQASEYIVITDPDGNIEYVNPAFTQVTGYEREEAIGKNPRILKSGKHSREFYQDLWDTIKSGKIWKGEFINRRKNGEEYYDRTVIFPIRDESGDIINFAAIKQDITEEKIREKRLIQAEKMNTIGALTGGIAHDFNNLLTVILGYSDFIINTSDASSPVGKYALKIKETGEKAKELTSKLLAFGRKQIYNPKIIDINEELLELKKMLSRLIPEDIDLNLDLMPDIPYIYADPVQIEQVLMNLIVNARDALLEKEEVIKESYQKVITIETSKVFLDDSYVKLHPGSRLGDFVLISISDNGIGMDQKTMDRIFEPFFSTKEEGKGTGLGLSTVYGIVKQNSGMIYVYSEPLEGTTFKIYWPVTEGEKEIKQSKEVKYVKGDGTIFVVEDNDEVREFIVKSLRELGYTIYDARDGIKLLEKIQGKNIKPDLLITDVIMPNMDGEKLSRKVVELYPNIKVLFISGYTYNHITHKGVLRKNINFLHKPFSVSELASSVKEILNKREVS